VTTDAFVRSRERSETIPPQPVSDPRKSRQCAFTTSLIFLAERDRMYAAFTALVVAILLDSLVGSS
jgi:hypothetical protein